MVFIFDVVGIDKSNTRMALRPWDVHGFKRLISKWQRSMIEHDGSSLRITTIRRAPRGMLMTVINYATKVRNCSR